MLAYHSFFFPFSKNKLCAQNVLVVLKLLHVGKITCMFGDCNIFYEAIVIFNDVIFLDLNCNIFYDEIKIFNDVLFLDLNFTRKLVIVCLFI
jgi:hypothetical protein